MNFTELDSLLSRPEEPEECSAETRMIFEGLRRYVGNRIFNILDPHLAAYMRSLPARMSHAEKWQHASREEFPSHITKALVIELRRLRIATPMSVEPYFNP